jgi:hypothetical protein
MSTIARRRVPGSSSKRALWWSPWAGTDMDTFDALIGPATVIAGQVAALDAVPELA